MLSLFRRTFSPRAIRRPSRLGVSLRSCGIHTLRLIEERSKYVAVTSSSVSPTVALSSSCWQRRSHHTMASPQSSAFVIPLDQPVVALDASDAFNHLQAQQKLYAHYLGRASFLGGLIVLMQTSPEAPQIFRLLTRLFSRNSVEELRHLAIQSGVSEDEFKALLVYASGVFTNMGNYKGFGDSKIVPDLTKETLEKIVKTSKAYKEDQQAMDSIWNEAGDLIFALSDRLNQLGLGERGVTKYFSSNCNDRDAALVNDFLKSRNMEGYISRVIKMSDDHYEIRHAGVNQASLERVEYEGRQFDVTTGDYAQLLKLVCDNLELAKEYASNDNERSMLSDYIRSFQQGSLDAHKDGSRHWILNKGPIIETYIGFIETYRDPVGMRGEFEGFVAMVNKQQSLKFQKLVNQASSILPLLPWPQELEKDKFLLPDFTSLDVLAFAGSGVPAGINIPNYDEIRQSEGFKNVNLGNVIAASYKVEDKGKRITFVSKDDHEVLKKYRTASFEVQVGIHELLGHGSGKLLQRLQDGSYNFDMEKTKDPLTKDKVQSVYEPGETYDSKFTTMGSSYEECRAETIGLYLSTYPDVLKIFGFDGDEADVIIYANWLSLLHSGVKAVETYSPATKEWKQAHSQARYVILQVLLEAGQGLVEVKEVTNDEDGKPDLLLTLNRDKLMTVGKPALEHFLLRLQVYKSTGDIEKAKAMYDEYSKVKDDGVHPFGKWRSIVMDRKTPRKMLVQANTVIDDKGEVQLLEYEASHEGMMQSWADRFKSGPVQESLEQLDGIIEELYFADKPHFH